jgi:hypothetical protein
MRRSAYVYLRSSSSLGSSCHRRSSARCAWSTSSKELRCTTGRSHALLLYNLPRLVTGAAGATTDIFLAIVRSHTHDAPFVSRAYCILDSTKIRIITQPSQPPPWPHSPSRSLHNPTACYLRSCPARYAGRSPASPSYHPLLSPTPRPLPTLLSRLLRHSATLPSRSGQLPSLPLSRLAARRLVVSRRILVPRVRTLWVIRATRRDLQVLGQTPSSLLRRPGSLSSRRYPHSPPRPCLRPLLGSLLRCIRTLPCQENATPVLAHTDLLGAPWEESQGS